MKDNPHVLFVSSWYPSPNTSEGTFVELHLLALQSREVKCAMLLNGEITFGNYLRSGKSKKELLNFRRRPDIAFVDSLAVHYKPLRFSKNPNEVRRMNILRTAGRSVQGYIRKNGKPDVIFHHGIFDLTYLSRHLSKVFDIPIWYMENSPNIDEGVFPCANSFEDAESLAEFVKSVDRRFAVTDAYVEKMQRVFGVPFEKVPNVLTDEYFVDNRPSKSTDEFIFVNIAILDERKRQDSIIKAFAKEFGGDTKFKLIIAGDGKLKSRLESLAEALNVSEQVRIPGYLNREEVVALLDRSHAFVLASRAETFGVVVVEALARGIPVISSDIDGTREIVNDKNGLLFKPGDEEDLSQKMRQLVGNYDIYVPDEMIADVKMRFGPDAVKKGLFGNE